MYMYPISLQHYCLYLDQVNAHFSALMCLASVQRLIPSYPANPQWGDHQNGDIRPVTIMGNQRHWSTEPDWPVQALMVSV